MSADSGGAKANRTGDNLEQFIVGQLERHTYVLQRRDKRQLNSLPDGPSYWSQFPIGPGIYDTPVKVDFLVYHPVKHPCLLIIEAKWQESSGSVDEKYPYLIQNIQKRYPYKTLLLLDGGGYKKGAEKWVRNQVGGNLIGVWSMAEFQTRVNNGFL